MADYPVMNSSDGVIKDDNSCSVYCSRGLVELEHLCLRLSRCRGQRESEDECQCAFRPQQEVLKSLFSFQRNSSSCFTQCWHDAATLISFSPKNFYGSLKKVFLAFFFFF